MTAAAPKNILALDTACGEIAACITAQEQHFTAPPAPNATNKTRSTVIIPLLHNLLQQADISWQQLDVLALGAGPGSFTGIRIAAATLAGINAGLKLPLLHLSSLAITARQTASTAAVHVLEDARAGELFAGYYQQGNKLVHDSCISWQQLETHCSGDDERLYCCHNAPAVEMHGWTRLALCQTRSSALKHEAVSACASVTDWQDIPSYPAPLYLQQSQAERQANA